MKHLLFIVLLTAILITTGCVGENKNIVVTPTQTTVTANIALAEPIVGMWQFMNVNGQVCTNTFLNDGMYTLTCTGGSDVTVKGNWRKIRTNEYQVSYESVKDVNNYIYQPETDTILNTVNNAILYRPGKMPSYASDSTPAADLVRMESITYSRNEYAWITFKGIVINDDSISHSVSAYIDLYDKNGVKFDHLLIFEDVDAHGKTAFEVTSTKAEDYRNGMGKYTKYIDKVY